MSLSAVKILGINVTISSKKEILEEIKKGLHFDTNRKARRRQSRTNSMTVVTPNPEQVVSAQGDSGYREILNWADVALPDGDGLVWAFRKLRSTKDGKNEGPITQTIHGVEFMQDLVGLAVKERVPIALIGGYGNLAVRALECLQSAYPGLTGVALGAPLMKVREGRLEIERQNNTSDIFRKTARTIADNGAKMVFIALGAPKQEYYMKALAAELEHIVKSPVLLMVVGGSFSIVTGEIPRAPQSIRQLRVPFFGGAIGSEWLWRLMREPWRWKRQLALVKFVFLVLKESFRTR